MKERVNDRYRLAGPKVIHEAFDDEVIVGNLECGHYHSLEGSAAEIWANLVRGVSLGRLIDRLARHYDSPREEIETLTRRFVDELQAQGLLVLAEGAGPDDPGEDGETSFAPTAERPAFPPPSLSTYTDMEELLLLDPIHDVDDSGWPSVKPAAGTETE